MQKKILYISNTANFSKFNRPFMHWCKENNWIVDYCAPDDEVISDCNEHIILPLPRSPFSKGVFFCIRKLRKILNEKQYDIIHCHTPMGGVIGRLAARFLFKKKKVKIIYTAHGFHFYKGAPLINWLLYYPVEKFLLRYTDVLVTINKEDYQFALKKFSKFTEIEFMNGVGVNLSKFTMIPNDDKKKIRENFGYKMDDFIITVVAELNKNKNQSFLISRIPDLLERIPSLKVIFLGKETLPIARELVEKLHLENVCDFLGYRKDVDLFEKMTDIVFSSSIREGLPVNIIEGMACGKVCVCSHNRGHSSLISDSNGLLFPLEDGRLMIDLIISIYNDSNKRLMLGNQAYQDSKQYSVENAVDFISKLYSKYISETEKEANNL